MTCSSATFWAWWWFIADSFLLAWLCLVVSMQNHHSSGGCDEEIVMPLCWSQKYWWNCAFKMISNSFLTVNSHISSEYKKCECRAARDCPRVEKNMFCVKLTRTQRTRSMDLCSMAALKCASYEFEILNEGVCESRWSCSWFSVPINSASKCI